MNNSANRSRKAFRENRLRGFGLRETVPAPVSKVGKAGARAVPVIRLGKILVPVDFARSPVKPLRYASAIAKAHDAKIVLLHVTPAISFCADYGYGPVNRQVADPVQIQNDLSRLKRSAARHLPPGSLEYMLIRKGTASEQILLAAQELEADLIVLYAHDASSPGAKVLTRRQTK